MPGETTRVRILRRLGGGEAASCPGLEMPTPRRVVGRKSTPHGRTRLTTAPRLVLLEARMVPSVDRPSLCTGGAAGHAEPVNSQLSSRELNERRTP